MEYPEPYSHYSNRNNKVRTLKNFPSNHRRLEGFPNFSVTGSVRGMKDKYYGKDALLVRCGDYIYNVSSAPNIYELAV